MALTFEQIEAADARRRALAVPPEPEPLPPVTSVPAPLYVQELRPTDVVAGSVFIPLDEAGNPLSVEQWQVLT